MSHKDFIRGRSFSFPAAVRDASTGDLVVNPSFSAGDVQIDKDGGGFANVTNLPSSPGAGLERFTITLTSAETRATNIVVRLKNASWKTQLFYLTELPNYGIPNAINSGITVQVRELATKTDQLLYQPSSKIGRVWLAHTKFGAELNVDQSLGSVIIHQNQGIKSKILGGYYFDDTTDTITQMFGMATNTLFGLKVGDATAYDTFITSFSLDTEETFGSGWTFFVEHDNNSWTGNVANNDQLSIYQIVGALDKFSASDNEVFEARQLKLNNDSGIALDVQTSNDGDPAVKIKQNTSSNSQALVIEAANNVLAAALKLLGGGTALDIAGGGVASAGRGVLINALSNPALQMDSDAETVDINNTSGSSSTINISGSQNANPMINIDHIAGTGNVIEIKIAGSEEGLIINGTKGITAAIIDEILADTADIQPKIGTPAADVSTDIANVKAQTNNIETDTQAIEAALAIVDSNVDAIVAKLPASGLISNLNLSSLVDGQPLSYAIELVMAISNGRYSLNTPSSGDVTFYKRDNVTPLTVVNRTTAGRTRSS